MYGWIKIETDQIQNRGGWEARMKREELIAKDKIRCHNTEKADVRFQDGALRHAIGTHCFQVMRACKDVSRSTDGFGWTYNHAAMLVWWKDHFYVDYLSDPVSEHVPPSQTLISRSADGSSWSRPVVLFPPICAPTAPYCGPKAEFLRKDTVECVMHQRMSFFVSSDNRLLATGFYGIAPNDTVAPNNGYGVGRVVREVYEDFTFSDIYFLRYNEAGGYTAEYATQYPHFTKSGDEGFVAACRELLSNRLVTQQMWEEERLDTGFFTQPGAEALSYYTKPDGEVMGVYKKSLVTSSTDGGESFAPLEKDASLETSTGKVWGERTQDGRYALAYNPTTDSAHRWPIAVISGENGEDFDDLLTITPEVSPHKYAGLYKNLGPQYIRGIVEHNPKPDDNRLWLAYTVNKEDVWVSATELPLRGVETEELDMDFRGEEPSGFVKGWNLYCPLWSPVRIEQAPDTAGQSLMLYDADPYDRGRAMRVFPEKEAFEARMEIMPDGRDERTAFTIELQDRHGSVAVRMYFRNDGMVVVKNGGRYDEFCTYKKGEWMTVVIRGNCFQNKYTVAITQGGEENVHTFSLNMSMYSVERILFTTKTTLPFNTLEDCGKWGDLGNLKDADVPLAKGSLAIASVSVSALSLEESI